MFARYVFAILCVLAVTVLPARATTEAIEARVTAVDAASGTIRLDFPAPLGAVTLPVDDPAKAMLGDVQVNDIMRATLDDAAKPTRVKALVAATRAVSWFGRLFALLFCFAALVALAALVTGGKPRAFLIGADNRYSNSHVQLAAWYAAVMTVYLATLVLRVAVGGLDYLGGVMIPQNLLVLSGLSALTFGGAKVITVQKIDAAAAAAPLAAAAPKWVAPRPRLLTDLVQNDNGAADIGDFQMIVVTLVAVIVFVLSSLQFLAAIRLSAQVTLPDIDTTLLSGFGLGQGTYLIKKIASRPGEG